MRKVVWLMLVSLVASTGLVAAIPQNAMMPGAQLGKVMAKNYSKNMYGRIANESNGSGTMHKKTMYKNMGNMVYNKLQTNNSLKYGNNVYNRMVRHNRTHVMLVKEKLRKIGVRGIEESYIKAKEHYFKLKYRYMKLKNRGLMNFTCEKMFCMAAGNLVLRWFDRMEVAILNTRLNETLKNQLISKIEQEKMAFEEKLRLVNSTENPQQLREVAKQLREQWRQAKNVVSEVVMEVVITKLDRTTITAEKLEEKLSTIAPGSELLKEYLNKVQQARRYIEDAKKQIKTGNTLAAREDIKMAIMSLREAFINAKQIVRELNMQGKELGSIANPNAFGFKSGNLNLFGNGTFSFEGKGIVVVSAKNATITYVGNLSNVTGFTNTNGTLRGTGKAFVTGNVSVTVTGEGVHMFVKGVGTAHLSGTGIYWYNNRNRIQKNTLNGSVEIHLGG
ncbi:MAG: hypothetical protein DSY33_05985 [Archaeoglobus sp.]|nr:MAG: hypothetical protein DSY33_05985 [Archaeoglobus sp.]